MHSDVDYGLKKNIVAALLNLGEALGRWSSSPISPERRRALRAQSISATLALENHSVPASLIAAAMNNDVDDKAHADMPSEFVLARNHFSAYWRLSHWHPYIAQHLLSAHHQLNSDYVSSAGQWRDTVGELEVQSLLKEIEAGKHHPVIESCIVHYRLVKLRPFNRGNGGIARLWQTLILSRWRHEMTLVPYEKVLEKNQQEYLSLLGRAAHSEGLMDFVEFMLAAIVEACEKEIEHQQEDTIKGLAGKVAGKTASSVLEQLSTDPHLTIPQVADRIGVTERTVERSVRKLKEAQLLERVGSAKGGHWQVADPSQEQQPGFRFS